MISKSFQITQQSTAQVIHGEATVSVVNTTPYNMTFTSPSLTGRFAVTPYPIALPITFDDTMTFLSGGNLNSGSTIDPILETCTQELSWGVTSLSAVNMAMTWPVLSGFTSSNPIGWSAALMIYVDESVVRNESFTGTVLENGAPDFTSPWYTLLTGFPVPQKIRFEIVMTYSYRGS